MPEKKKIVLAGIGGYGYFYLKTLLDEVDDPTYHITGIVEPEPKYTDYLKIIKNNKIPVFHELDDYFQAGLKAGLVILSTPIHLHDKQIETALRNGSDVLCDKPLGTDYNKCRDLSQFVPTMNNWVMIGYQWSFTEAIKKLKKDILSGLFGIPKLFKAICLWPRDDTYYSRNYWAGKNIDSKGNKVLDSPASNAMAHFLHNLLFLGGKGMNISSEPVSIESELYRIHKIESFDTIAARIKTENNTDILFYASHASSGSVEPEFELFFEKGKVTFNVSDGIIFFDTNNKVRKKYGTPFSEHQFRKLFLALENTGKNYDPVCNVKTSLPHVKCIYGIDKSRRIINFPNELIKRSNTEKRNFSVQIDKVFRDCYNNNILPNKYGVNWSEKAIKVDLTDI